MKYLKEVDLIDIEDFIKVIIKTWKETYRNILPNLFLNKMTSNKDNLIREEQDSFIDDKLDGTRKYLFKVKDVIVGYLVIGRCPLEEYDGCGELNALYLLKKYQNMGYGNYLFKRACEELKSMGFQEIVIGCIKDSLANNFYIKKGARLVEQRKRYIMDLEVDENIYLYEL